MNMSRAALEYLKQGKPIFPVQDKKPLVLWKSFQSTLPSEEQVVKWWTQWPEAGIGMATGKLSNILVVDCDSTEAAMTFRKQYPEAEATARVKTGKGQHIYFQYIDGVFNSASKLGPGLDIRGEGGYVVLPPSIHANGQQYLWGYNRDILPASEALIAAILETDKVFQGQRHNMLLRYIGKLRHEGLEENEILEKAIEINQKRCCPPETDHNLNYLVHDICQRYAAGTRLEDIKDPNKLTVLDIPKTITGEHYLWDGLIKAGACHLLASKPEVGKTTLAINLALAISRGVPFLQINSNKNSVLYCYFDKGGNQEDLIEAYEIFGVQPGEIPCIAEPLKPDSLDLVISTIKEQQARFVVIDTLIDVLQTEQRLTGTLYSNSRKLCKPIMQFAAKEKIALLFLTHLRKQQEFKGEDPFDEIIDSTGYRGMVHKSFLYHLFPDSDIRLLESSRGRGFHFPLTQITFGENGWLVLGGDYNFVTHLRLKETILDIVRKHGPISNQGVYNEIGGYNPARYHILKELLKEGIISKVGKGIRGDPWMLSYTPNIKIRNTIKEIFGYDSKITEGGKTV